MTDWDGMDPELWFCAVLRIRIRWIGTYPDPAFRSEYRSGSMVLMTKNWEKFTAEKNQIFLVKNDNLPIPTPKGRPSYRRSLQPSKENMKHFET
jgi:hypothetical protein